MISSDEATGCIDSLPEDKMFSLSLSQVNRGDSLSSLKLTEVRLAVLSETLTLGNGGMGYGHVEPWGMLGYGGWYSWVWLDMVG